MMGETTKSQGYRQGPLRLHGEQIPRPHGGRIVPCPRGRRPRYIRPHTTVGILTGP